MSLLLPVRAAAAAACLLIAGCAAPKPQPEAAQVAKPMPAAGEPNGEYRGTTTRYQSDSRSCPHPGLVTLIVFDDKFQYRWDHDTWLDATIGSDGRVSAEGPGITLRGQVNGRRIEGDVGNGVCGFHFTVTKRNV